MGCLRCGRGGARARCDVGDGAQGSRRSPIVLSNGWSRCCPGGPAAAAPASSTTRSTSRRHRHRLVDQQPQPGHVRSVRRRPRTRRGSRGRRDRGAYRRAGGRARRGFARAPRRDPRVPTACCRRSGAAGRGSVRGARACAPLPRAVLRTSLRRPAHGVRRSPRSRCARRSRAGTGGGGRACG
jgi:hypothetical protein